MTLTVVALLSEPVHPEEPKTAVSHCLRYYSDWAHRKSAQIPPLFDSNIDSLLLTVHYNSYQGPSVHESKEFAQSRIQKLQEMPGMNVSLLFGGVVESIW